MRNVIAGLVAVAAVAAVVWFGWMELSERTAPETARPLPEDVMAAFIAAFNAGDEQAMADLVHPEDRVGLDGFLAAVAAMRADLDLADARLSLGEVEQDGQRATATTTLAVTLADLPGAAEIDPAEDIATDGPTGTAADEPTVAGADEAVGTIAWLAALPAVERRSGWFVQPDRSSLHPSLTGDTSFRRREVDTPRASILAVDGTPLTAHGDLETLGIAPGQIRDAGVLRERWREVLPQSSPQLEAVLGREDLVPDWFYPIVALPASEVEAAWSRLRTLPGVIRRAIDEVDGAATSTIAVHVIGSVGRPDPELAVELGVGGDDVTGLSGLERVFEDRLVGSDTVEVTLETAEGAVVEVLGEAQVDPSSPVATSLDATLQSAVESALLGIDDLVAVVAVRIDGGIAASASRPLSGYNRAWEGKYPPGDLFFPVSAGALVRGGTDLATEVACPRVVTVAGAGAEAPRPLPGEVAFATALAAGCDTSLAILAEDLPAEDLVDMASHFGWEEEPELPLDAATPTFPPPVDATETIRAALGQARVEATPLHLASVAASTLAGSRVAPWLLVDDAGEPARIPFDTSGLVEVTRAAAVDGSGSTVSGRDIGVVVGTAPVTGTGTIHSWSMLLVDDLGIVVLVEDTDGDLDLVRRISRRIEGELVALGGTSGPTEPATPDPTATGTATPDPDADATATATPAAAGTTGPSPGATP